MCISACITKEKRVKVEEGRGAEGSDSACVCLMLSSNLVIALKKNPSLVWNIKQHILLQTVHLWFLVNLAWVAHYSLICFLPAVIL